MQVWRNSFICLLISLFPSSAFSKAECKELSWSIVKSWNKIFIEAEVYNSGPSRLYSLVFTFHGANDNLYLKLASGNKNIEGKQSEQFKFTAPPNTLKKVNAVSVLSTNFVCDRQPPKRNFCAEEASRTKAKAEAKRAEMQDAKRKAIIKAKKDAEALDIRAAEIYDNCIIDLMPDQPKIQPTKRAAIKSKCERISKNPSFLENLKY